MVGSPASDDFPVGINVDAGWVLAKCNQISECFYGISTVGNLTIPSALIGNYEANCACGLVLDEGTKYQRNVTTNCTPPVSGGIAVGRENG